MSPWLAGEVHRLRNSVHENIFHEQRGRCSNVSTKAPTLRSNRGNGFGCNRTKCFRTCGSIGYRRRLRSGPMFTCDDFRSTHLYAFCTDQVISCRLTAECFVIRPRPIMSLVLLNYPRAKATVVCIVQLRQQILHFLLIPYTHSAPPCSFHNAERSQPAMLFLSFRLGRRSTWLDKKQQVGRGGDWWLLEAILN